MSLTASLLAIGFAAGISAIALLVYLLCVRVFGFVLELALFVFMTVVLFLLFLVLNSGVIK